LKNSSEKNKKILSYLYSGYDITRFAEFVIHRPVLTIIPPPPPYVYNAQEAAKIFDKVMSDIFSTYHDFDTCVVPISGGFDSRILLGAALEHLGTKQIKTFSFGVPGQLDYDIGTKVAKKCKVEHIPFDLSKIPMTWEALINFVGFSRWTITLESFFYQTCINAAVSKNNIILSGFLGETLTGSHLSHFSTKEDIEAEFVSRQRWERSIDLLPGGFDIKDTILFYSNTVEYAYSDVLDLGIRQAYYIVSELFPGFQWDTWRMDMGTTKNGAKIVTPFGHPDWVAYWLNAPHYVRYKQKLYLDMMEFKFPDLANIPSKNYLGVSSNDKIKYQLKSVNHKAKYHLNRVFPKIFSRDISRLNYIDFAMAFRKREDYRSVLEQACDYLIRNDVIPWINIKKLLWEHMNYKANYENAFMLFIGLALNLEYEEKNNKSDG
jgi:hypothetical protein